MAVVDTTQTVPREALSCPLVTLFCFSHSSLFPFETPF